MIFFWHRKEYSDGELKLVLRRKYKAEKSLGIQKTYVFDMVLCANNQLVGQCDLRVGDEGWYLYYLGHIGYSVYIPYRGHHYAAKACKLLYQVAKAEKMTKLIITCSPENIASYKTLTYLGAQYTATVDVPAEHDLYRRGEVRKCIFEVEL